VETVEHDTQRAEWLEVLNDGFGLSGDDAAQVMAAHGWAIQHERDRVYLLLRREGVAVATALLHTYAVSPASTESPFAAPVAVKVWVRSRRW
jgi:hypothetical protein